VGFTFDTLKFVEKLESGGFTHEQAKAAAEAFATSQQLATKADLRELELRITVKLGGLIVGATGVIIAAAISLTVIEALCGEALWAEADREPSGSLPETR
jgi:proteasome assembly chaperone (PAC2) family protein